MQPVENKSASGETVVLDDKVFLNCTFTRCRLIFGGGDFQWENTHFIDCQIQFAGPADRTVNFLRAFNLKPETIGRPSAPPAPMTPGHA